MFYVGLDLGKQRDHSAIVVLQRMPGQPLRAVRSVVRIPLGTPYQMVVERVREVVQHDLLYGRCRLVVDGGNVGVPVMEMLGQAGLGCDVTAVTSTGGKTARARGIGSWCTVPKKDLLAGVLVLLEQGKLRFAKEMPGLASLLRELKDMQVDVTVRGNLKMAAEGAGRHDDLVIALALACWGAGQPRYGLQSHQLLW